MVANAESIAKEKKNRIKWGFFWAIMCAVLWGMGYVPLTILWGVDPFSNFVWFEGQAGYLVSGVIIAGMQAVVFAVVLLLFWAGLTGKFVESIKTFVHFKISKWLLVAALFGGPCAVFGSTIAIGYIGAGFASAIGLLSAVVGALMAKLMYSERFSKKTVAGILLLLAGGFIILNPLDMINNITNPAAPDGVWLGYLGGIMSAVGWGLEGCYAVRALDTTDADSSLPVRYTWEALIWVAILFPVVAIIAGFGNFYEALFAALTSSSFMFWMVMAAFTLGMCYATMYKCYPLIGVGRTLSLTAMYSPIAIIVLFVFFGVVPAYWIFVGAIVAVAGMFVMYWESDSISDTTREEV